MHVDDDFEDPFSHMQYDLEQEHTSAATASELFEQTAEQLLDASPIFLPKTLFNWTSNSNRKDHNNLRSHFWLKARNSCVAFFFCARPRVDESPASDPPVEASQGDGESGGCATRTADRPHGLC